MDEKKNEERLMSCTAELQVVGRWKGFRMEESESTIQTVIVERWRM